MKTRFQFFCGYVPVLLILLLLMMMMMTVWPSPARADSVMRIVVPTGPGGNLDALARLFSKYIAERSIDPVIVENKPGGDSMIGTRFVMRAAPDGRTLLLSSSSVPIAAATPQHEFDPLRDLKPVVMLTTSENILTVNPATEIRSIDDLVRRARAQPQGLNCGGVPGQMALACQQLGVQLPGQVVTIPFQSLAPALNALLAGHVDLMFAPRVSVGLLVSQGRLGAVASLGGEPPRPPYENLPLLKDTWPSMRMHTYAALYAPATTPPELVAKMNREFNQMLALPEVRAHLGEMGYLVAGGPPEVLSRQLAADIEFYRKLTSDAAAGSTARR